jgi:hypothetical protein
LLFSPVQILAHRPLRRAQLKIANRRLVGSFHLSDVRGCHEASASRGSHPDDGTFRWLAAKRAARQTKVERVTASRDLARMEELGVIEKDPTAGRRSTRYRVRFSERSPLRLIKELNWS